MKGNLCYNDYYTYYGSYELTHLRIKIIVFNDNFKNSLVISCMAVSFLVKAIVTTHDHCFCVISIR